MNFTRDIQPAGESMFRTFAKQFDLGLGAPGTSERMQVLLISAAHPELAVRLNGINKALHSTQTDGHIGYFAFNDAGANNYKHMSFIKEYNPDYVWEKILSVDQEFYNKWCGILFFPVWAQTPGGVLERTTKHVQTIRGCAQYQFKLGYRPSTYSIWSTLPPEEQKQYRMAVELSRAMLLTGMEFGVKVD